jgi:hypothetical protein
MELDFALLTDNVDPSPNGSLHLWGAGFEGLLAPSFPAVHRFAVVVKMSASPEEAQRGHPIALEVTDADGERRQIMSDANARVPQSKNPLRPIYATFILGLAYGFTKAGLYTFKFFVDGREVKSWPIYLDEFAGKPSEVTP